MTYEQIGKHKIRYNRMFTVDLQKKIINPEIDFLVYMKQSMGISPNILEGIIKEVLVEDYEAGNTKRKS